MQTNKTKKKKNENEVQKKIIYANMEKLNSVQMSQTIDPLEKKFLECIEIVEKNNDMALVIKGNKRANQI